MESAQYAPAGFGFVVLHEAYGPDGLVELLLGVAFEEIAAVVAEDLRLDNNHVLDRGKLYVDVIASFVEILRQIFLVLQATGKLLRGKRDTDRAFGLRGSCRLRGLLRAIRRCGGFRLLGAGAKTNDKNEREKQGNKFFHYEFLL